MIQAKSLDDLCRVSDSTLHEMLRTVVLLLGSPCKSSWWLFQSGQHGLGGKCCYEGINSVRKLFNSATYTNIPVNTMAGHVMSSPEYKTWPVHQKGCSALGAARLS